MDALAGRQTHSSIMGDRLVSNSKAFEPRTNSNVGLECTTGCCGKITNLSHDDVQQKIEQIKKNCNEMQELFNNWQAKTSPFQNGDKTNLQSPGINANTPLQQSRKFSPSEMFKNLDNLRHLEDMINHKMEICELKNAKRIKKTQECLNKVQKELLKYNSGGAFNPDLRKENLMENYFDLPITDSNIGNGRNGCQWGLDHSKILNRSPSFFCSPQQGNNPQNDTDNSQGNGAFGLESKDQGQGIARDDKGSNGDRGNFNSSLGSDSVPSPSAASFPSSIDLKGLDYYDFMMTFDIHFQFGGSGGVYFRHFDNFNTYVIELSPNDGSCTLKKNLYGDTSILDKIDDCGVVSNTWATVRVKVRGTNIIVNVYPYPKCPKPQVLKANDSSLAKGGLSLFCNSNNKINFMNVKTKVLPCLKLWEPNANIVYIPATSDLFQEDFKGGFEAKWSTITSPKLNGQAPVWRYEADGVYQKSTANDESNQKIPNIALIKDKTMKIGKYVFSFVCESPNGSVYSIFKYTKNTAGKEETTTYYFLELTNQNNGYTHSKQDISLKVFTNGVVKTLFSFTEQINSNPTFATSTPLGYKPSIKHTVEINITLDYIYAYLILEDSTTYKLFKLRNAEIEIGQVGVGTNGTICQFTDISLSPNLKLPTAAETSQYAQAKSDMLMPDPINKIDEDIGNNEVQKQLENGVGGINQVEPITQEDDYMLHRNLDSAGLNNEASVEAQVQRSIAGATETLKIAGGEGLTRSQITAMYRSSEESKVLITMYSIFGWYKSCVMNITYVKANNYCTQKSLTENGLQICKVIN